MKKTNNKGFSLVELIIVIAIMVILVAVIAPQYLKFVNNSKIGTDVQTAADIVTSVNIAVANSEKPFTSNTDTTLADTNASTGTALSAIVSRYNGAAAAGTWVVYGNDMDGVKSVSIKVGTDYYEVYPNPENTGKIKYNGTNDTKAGMDAMTDDDGLRK